MRALILMGILLAGCGVSVTPNPDPVDVSISVTAGGKPVSGMKFNFQPTESGLPAVAEITDGKCQTKVTPGKYTWYVSAGKDEALLSTVPEEYLEGAMERQIEVKGGDAIEVSLD